MILLSFFLVEIAHLPSLVNGPFVIDVQLAHLSMAHQRKQLLHKKDPLDQLADICLLLHLLPAFVHLFLEVKTLPFIGRLIEECDDAV